jgi:hypothetical protein
LNFVVVLTDQGQKDRRPDGQTKQTNHGTEPDGSAQGRASGIMHAHRRGQAVR